jgi:hypothetical protein
LVRYFVLSQPPVLQDSRMTENQASSPDSDVRTDEAGFSTASVMSVTQSDIPDPLPCRLGNCTASFHGIFRRVNRSRHIRIVHEVRGFLCGIDGCRKAYRRQDARRKHRVNRHADCLPQTNTAQAESQHEHDHELEPSKDSESEMLFSTSTSQIAKSRQR